MAKMFSVTTERCFASAHHALRRVHSNQRGVAGEFHAGVDAVKPVVERAHIEELEPITLAKRLWDIRLLAEVHFPSSLWSDGLTEGSSAALHAVLSHLPDDMTWTPPVPEAHSSPALAAAEAATALGYKIQLVNDFTVAAGSGWRWILAHTRPKAMIFESAIKFGNPTRAYRNACEHALETLEHPTWKWPNEAASAGCIHSTGV